jgi:hypothetical protein
MTVRLTQAEYKGIKADQFHQSEFQNFRTGSFTVNKLFYPRNEVEYRDIGILLWTETKDVEGNVISEGTYHSCLDMPEWQQSTLHAVLHFERNKNSGGEMPEDEFSELPPELAAMLRGLKKVAKERGINLPPFPVKFAHTTSSEVDTPKEEIVTPRVTWTLEYCGDRKGETPNIGDTIEDACGESFVLLDTQPPHKPESTGRVIVQNDEGRTMEYFPSVFNMAFKEVRV